MSDPDLDPELPELADWTVPPPPAGLVDRVTATARTSVAREAIQPPRSGVRLAVMLVVASAGGAALASAFWAAAYSARSSSPPPVARAAPPAARQLPPMDKDGVIRESPSVDAGAVTLQVPPPPVTRTRKATTYERAVLGAAITQARQLRAGSSGPSAPSLDKADIQKSIREVIPLLAECFDMAPDDVRRQGGRLVTEMTVAGEPDVGTVIEDATFSEGDPVLLNDADFTECVHETLMSVEMPPVAEGGVVTIRYPFAFSDGAEPPAPKQSDATSSKEPSLQDLIESCTDADRAGEYGKALDYCEQALLIEPDNQQALTGAGIAACNLKDVKRAKAYAAKLSGPRAQMVTQICKRNGVSL